MLLWSMVAAPPQHPVGARPVALSTRLGAGKRLAWQRASPRPSADGRAPPPRPGLGPAGVSAPRPRAACAASPAPSPPPSPACQTFDFVVLGSGIAGLTFALRCAEFGRVALVTKGSLGSDGCTGHAQGGICAVLDALDSVDAHVRDTLEAGAWLGDEAAARLVCSEAAPLVLELAALGARFTRAQGALHLTREGGHSARRIVHAADATGAEISRALVERVRAHAGISAFERSVALDLVLGERGGGRWGALESEAGGQRARCLGVDVLVSPELDDSAAMPRLGDPSVPRHPPSPPALIRLLAPLTMLATGGAGQIYPCTTNPSEVTGDGIAMAARAGAAVANLEFVQFHPTALHAPACPDPAAAAPARRAFLLSEALRGEGAVLLDSRGERFMPRADPRAELAPRDVVARAIAAEMGRSGAPCVWLDASRAAGGGDALLRHFPTIAAHVSDAGLDLRRDPLPVAPAQHFMCGGVRADAWARASLPGLMVAGEAACSGLHGANRLASNSLLEGLVYGARGAKEACRWLERDAFAPGSSVQAELARASASTRPAPTTPPLPVARWAEGEAEGLRALMWRGAGIVRTRRGLKAALARVAETCVQARAMLSACGPDPGLAELFNMASVGELVLSSALQRRESRGGHFVLEHPAARDECRVDTVFTQTLQQRMAAALSGGLGEAGAPATGAGAQPKPRAKPPAFVLPLAKARRGMALARSVNAQAESE